MGNKAGAILKVLNLQQGGCQQDISSQDKKTKMEWPFSIMLPKTLTVGNRIEIVAKIAQNADTFTLNLVGDYEAGSKPHNVIYHHKILFNEGRTVLNSKRDGQWQDEIEELETGMLPAPGDTFKMFLIVKEESTIAAYFEDTHHSDYEHDFNLQDIKYFQIWHGLDKILSITITFTDPNNP